MPQEICKLVDGFTRMNRVVVICGFDRAEGIVKKMWLDLSEHDLDTLPCFQVVLMLPNELHMQPDVIEHAADDDRGGQKSNRLSGICNLDVQEHGDAYHNDVKERNQLFLFPSCPVITNGLKQQNPKKNNADTKAGVGQRPSVELVTGTDPKTQVE